MTVSINVNMKKIPTNNNNMGNHAAEQSQKK